MPKSIAFYYFNAKMNAGKNKKQLTFHLFLHRLTSSQYFPKKFTLKRPVTYVEQLCKITNSYF